MQGAEIRAGRLRAVMRHASTVKSREELVRWAQGRFGVTVVTATGYVDSVIQYLEQQKKNKELKKNE